MRSAATILALVIACVAAGRASAAEPRLGPSSLVYQGDPDGSSKGTHAYPYVPEVWAYDAGDLAAVRKGIKKPWSVKPYATWKLPLTLGSPQIGGVAYDPAAGIVYVSQQFGDDTAPLVHVFSVRR